MSSSDPHTTPDVPTPPAAPPAYAAPAAPAAPAYEPAATPPAYAAPPAYQAPPAQPGGYPPAPYGDAPAYAAAPAYGGYPAAPKTNTLAIVSLVASIVGFLWILPFIGSLAGVICGHISLGQLKTSGEGGRGLALAGTIIGWVGLALTVLGIIAIVAFLTIAAASYSTVGNPLVP